MVANGTELKNCIEEYENSIVYIWTPRCKSQYCYPLNILQAACKQEGIELFVVAEYYDPYYMSRYYDIENPLIGIDVKHYKTNVTSRYLAKFVDDLTNDMYQCSLKNESYCNFLRFNNGKFKNAFEAIKQIKKN